MIKEMREKVLHHKMQKYVSSRTSQGYINSSTTQALAELPLTGSTSNMEEAFKDVRLSLSIQKN